MKWLDNGSVDSPAGISAFGLACGIKKDGQLDLSIIKAEHSLSAAGVFTTNQVKAAPVVYCAEVLSRNPDRIAGVVINSGNANAVTGAQGMQATRQTAQHAADVLNASDGHDYFVMSTGVIGAQLPVENLLDGLEQAASADWDNGGALAAQAIMTTDTVPKSCAVQIELAGGMVTIGGIAKGAGMIHPDMATLLGCLTTDAALDSKALQSILERATNASFNRISIDGDTSTNDTVLLLASGASQVTPTASELAIFEDGVLAVCQHLAKAIIRDGEGTTKFITIHISGARDEQEARQVANTIATSALVKTAFYGEDANWGRVLAAAGRSSVDLDIDKLALWFDDLQLLADGAPTAYDEADATTIVQQSDVTLRLDLGLGKAETTVWSCDLSHDYVSINANYRT